MVALTPSPDKNSQMQQVVVSQQQTINGLQSQLQNIQSEVSVVNTGLQRIGTQIKNDSLLERTRLLEEQKREKSLSERQVRLGKESDVEQQIDASLTKSTRGLESRVNDTFGGVTNSLGALFNGFLGTGVIQNIGKIASFGIKGLGNLKSFFGKSLGFVGNTIKSFKDGLSKITGTIGKIVQKVISIAVNLAKSPIKFIADLFKSITGAGAAAGGKAASAGGSIIDDLLKLGGRAVSAGAGGVVAAATDLATGEQPDRAIAGGLGAAVFGGLGALGGSILGPGGTFGGGVAGSIYGQEKGKELYDYINKNFNFQAFSQNSPDLLNNLNINPTQFLSGLFGQQKPEDEKKSEMVLPSEPKVPDIQIPSSNSEASSTNNATPQTPAIPTPLDPEMEKNFEMAWNNRDKPFARGRIESAWNNMTPEQQKQAKDWAESKGHDWSEMKLTFKESPIIQPPPKPEVSVGALPEPSPNVVVASTANQNQSSVQGSSQSRVASDVPLLPSANIDNFYSLYSQTHYNVVM